MLAEEELFVLQRYANGTPTVRQRPSDTGPFLLFFCLFFVLQHTNAFEIQVREGDAEGTPLQGGRLLDCFQEEEREGARDDEEEELVVEEDVDSLIMEGDEDEERPGSADERSSR